MFISLLSYTKLSNPSGFERYNMRDKKIIIKVSEKEKDLFVKESCGRAHNTLIEIVNTEKSDACNNAQKQRNIVVKILIKKFIPDI